MYAEEDEVEEQHEADTSRSERNRGTTAEADAVGEQQLKRRNRGTACS